MLHIERISLTAKVVSIRPGLSHTISRLMVNLWWLINLWTILCVAKKSILDDGTNITNVHVIVEAKTAKKVLLDAR